MILRNFAASGMMNCTPPPETSSLTPVVHVSAMPEAKDSRAVRGQEDAPLIVGNIRACWSRELLSNSTLRVTGPAAPVKLPGVTLNLGGFVSVQAPLAGAVTSPHLFLKVNGTIEETYLWVVKEKNLRQLANRPARYYATSKGEYKVLVYERDIAPL